MGSKKWNSSDKLNLMQQFASGSAFETIGKNLNRSTNAIKLRLESIVYENLAGGKNIRLLQKMLNTDADTIKQFYYSHKSFLQSRGKDVIDVKFENNEKKHEAGVKVSVNKKSSTTKTQKGGTIGSKSKKDIATANGDNLKRIQEENKVLEEIIKNYTLKRHIKKLYSKDKLDKKTISIYEKLFRK